MQTCKPVYEIQGIDMTCFYLMSTDYWFLHLPLKQRIPASIWQLD